MGKPRYKKKTEQVSRKFKILVERYICTYGRGLTHSYKPSPVEIEYLAEYVIRKTVWYLTLKKVILTEETGSYLGKLLNNSQIFVLFIQIRNDGDLALIRETKKIEEYNFSNSKIRHDKIESLANSVNHNLLTYLKIRDSNITDDGLQIIFKVIKIKIKEGKNFSYGLWWDHSSDFNALELDEFFDCVESYEFRVHNDDSELNGIHINNINNMNSYLTIFVNYNRIKTDIKLFLNRYKSKDLLFAVYEHKTDCVLLLSMIDIIKELPIRFSIHCDIAGFIGQAKLNRIMERLIKTDLTDLKLFIYHHTSDDFDIIIDKIRYMKLKRLSLEGMKMINFNSLTVFTPLELSGLHCLSIDDCKLNYKLKKQLFCKLEHSNLEKFSISGSNFNKKLAGSISKSLIRSNLTSVTLCNCGINCKLAKMIAKLLKYTNISFLNLGCNRIQKFGVEAIAKVVGQTKLNTLILNRNGFNESSTIALLKSVEKTKITICRIDDSWYSREFNYEAIANVLKDNKILLKCIENGENDKIDEYLQRNNNSLEEAKLIIDKYQKGTISYHYKYKEYFKAYESFVETDILWDSINDKRTIKLKLGNKIKDNYMKICGIVNEKLEVNENTKTHTNVSNLSLDILNKICSSLSLNDVIS